MKYDIKCYIYTSLLYFIWVEKEKNKYYFKDRFMKVIRILDKLNDCVTQELMTNQFC